jgi:hypothetical protein
MSPEEMQRTMQFLLQQQAQFAADLAKQQVEGERLSERLTRLAGVVEGLTESVGGLTQTVGGVTEMVGGLTGIVGQLAASQERTQQQCRESDSRQGELGDYIRTVETHLNLLIEMFERHLREDHGPRPS